MSVLLSKKNKDDENIIENYMSNIISKCEKEMISYKKPIKINDDKISIPTIENYNELTKYNYNVAQLKLFAKHYKLKCLPYSLRDFEIKTIISFIFKKKIDLKIIQ